MKDIDPFSTVIPPLPINLEEALQHTLNTWSAENGSNTPDFILAQYLKGCLDAWNHGVQRREEWYGRKETYLGAEKYPFTFAS